MAEFWEQMKLTLYFMRMEDKYWGLFLMGLAVLFGLRRKETGRLLALSLLLSLICICPVTAYGLSAVFPFLGEYYRLWHLVPAGVVVCAALTLLYSLLSGEGRRQAVYALGVFAILFFAGEFAYTSRDAFNNDRTFLGKEESGAYELVLRDMKEQGKETACLWGPYKVMADCRIYSPAFLPVYGKDIAMEESEYSDTLKSMYEGYTRLEEGDPAADNRDEQIMAVANCLNVFPEIPCDYVIMADPKTAGGDVDCVWIFEALGYVYVGEADTLQIFRRME